MDLRQKGFTLIESIVTLFLFSILMGALWQFYGNTFKTYIQFDNQTNLMEHSRIVNSFIREELRAAEQITIVTTTEEVVIGFSGVITPPQTPPTSESSRGVSGLALKRIQLCNGTTGAGSTISERTLELKRNSPIGEGQGKYKLVYRANGTESLISDKVENIKVTREENSPIVQFECIIHKEGESEEKLKVKSVFSESLAYKEKRTP